MGKPWGIARNRRRVKAKLREVGVKPGPATTKRAESATHTTSNKRASGARARRKIPPIHEIDGFQTELPGSSSSQ